MKPSIRISIAYVLGCLINDSTFDYIMAKTENQYLKMSGKFDQSNIDVEEYETGNKYYGMVQRDFGSFVHGAENASIKFNLIGMSFTGSDSDSGKSFSGNVIGKTVNLYDNDENKHFYYYLS
jgi:hypothetical protein